MRMGSRKKKTDGPGVLPEQGVPADPDRVDRDPPADILSRCRGSWYGRTDEKWQVPDGRRCQNRCRFQYESRSSWNPGYRQAPSGGSVRCVDAPGFGRAKRVGVLEPGLLPDPCDRPQSLPVLRVRLAAIHTCPTTRPVGCRKTGVPGPVRPERRGHSGAAPPGSTAPGDAGRCRSFTCI